MAKATKTKEKKSKAGRKPATDPKQNVQFYCESSIIKAVGGMEAAREISYEALKERRNLILSKK